jgi:ABC-type Fe3+ transport system permease subunit
MVRVGAVAAWAVIAYAVIGNLTLPVLLSAPGTELLSVQLLQIYSRGSTAQAAALAIIILITMGMLLLLATLLNRLLRSNASVSA